MLDADDVGKFVGVATAGRWTSSSRFASRDAVVARICSRCAGRAFEDKATAMTRAARRRERRRSGLHALGISGHPRGSRIIASAIASCACANAQRLA